MIRFEWLSFDVQLTILNFLEPLDILRLRKTCKALQRTTSERIVWINALLRVCIRNTIFMPTFPIHDMELSLSVLEYAATGPERFLRTAARWYELEARSHCIMQHDRFRRIFLVPGGRYLVTIDFTKVEVWDLGIPGCSSMVMQSRKPISTMPTHPGFDIRFLLVQPTEDGRGLTIFINYEFKEILRLTILRIYPSDKLPSLLKIAEVDVPYPPHMAVSYCSLSRNKVIYLLGSTLHLWDYAEDSWAYIQVQRDYKKIIVSESTILLLYPDSVLIWKIPSLSTSKPLFSGSPPPNIPPAFILKIPNSQSVEFCRRPCDWYSGSPRPLLFDFSVGYGQLERFEVVHENENFKDSVVKTLGKYPDCPDRDYNYSRFCNDTLVFWWPLIGHTGVHVASLPSVTNSHTDPIDTIILLDKTSFMFSPCSLCPFSGRFAYSDRHDDMEVVKIVDYI